MTQNRAYTSHQILMFLCLQQYAEQHCDVTSVHGGKKYAAGHLDQLLRKAAGPQQMLLVHSLN